MNIPVFDLHCDTALKLTGREYQAGPGLRSNKLHIDLDRAGTLAGWCQCFACFTTPQMKKWYRRDPGEILEREIDAILANLEANSDVIRQAFSAAEVSKNLEAGFMSAILTLEGAAGLDYDPALLEDLFAVGFRITSLGWNEDNPLTGSHMTGGGLTDRGREYLKEAQRLGMLIDVSHISDKGFWDIMEMTQAPIIATHSNSRAVHNHSRNLTDDMFREIVNVGGVAGLNLYTDFIAEQADIDKCCDHIFHFMELDPSGKHIALGGDLDGCETMPKGFDGVQDYPKLSARLLESGLDEKTVRDIFWNNALGVMEKCSM